MAKIAAFSKPNAPAEAGAYWFRNREPAPENSSRSLERHAVSGDWQAVDEVCTVVFLV